MEIYEEILSKYFLADLHYQSLVFEAEQMREDILNGGLAQTWYSEIGIGVMGANVESLAIRAVEITEIISRMKEKVLLKKKILAIKPW